MYATTTAAEVRHVTPQHRGPYDIAKLGEKSPRGDVREMCARLSTQTRHEMCADAGL